METLPHLEGHPDPLMREHRRRALMSAKVRYAGSVTVEALVRDIASGGARLKLLQDLPVPDRFDLEIEGRRIEDCSVAWRRGVELGVRFAETLETLPSTGQRVNPADGGRPTLRRTR